MLIQLLRNSGHYTVPQLIMMAIIMFFALVISFSFHEFMHAFVADWLGDNTPRLYGRVTMNPKAHLDPMGTVLLLLVGFGWGKPVAYNPNKLNRFKSRRFMNIMVSLAGVFGNFLIALVSMIIVSIIMLATGFATNNPVVTCMYYVSDGIAGQGDVPMYAAVFCWLFYYTFLFSLSLMAFNLIPIPPLEMLALGGNAIISETSCLPEIFGKAVNYIDPNKSDYNLGDFSFEETKKHRDEVLNKYTWELAARKWIALLTK